MVLYGTTHRVGDDITTDMIIAPEHRTADDPAIFSAACLVAVDPALAERVRRDDALLVGRNFGAGNDPDIAVLALQAVGFAIIICVSAAPSFAKVASDYALPLLVAPQAAAEIEAGRLVRVDLAQGSIEDRATGIVYHAPPVEPEVLAVVARAHLLARMRQVVEEEDYDG